MHNTLFASLEMDAVGYRTETMDIDVSIAYWTGRNFEKNKKYRIQ